MGSFRVLPYIPCFTTLSFSTCVGAYYPDPGMLNYISFEGPYESKIFIPMTDWIPTYLQTQPYFLWISVSAKHQWSHFLRTKIIFYLARSNINIKRNWFYLSPFPSFLLKQSPILKRLLIKKYKTLQTISFFLIRNQKERSHLSFWIFSWH